MNDSFGCFVAGLVFGALLIMGGCAAVADGETGGFLAIFLGLALACIGWLTSKAESDQKAKSARTATTGVASPHRSISPSLQLRIQASSEYIEGIRIPVVKLATLGVFDPSRMLVRPEFEFRMWDITDGSSEASPPVLTIIEAWQNADNNEFTLRIPFDFPLVAGAGSDTWVELCKIPVPALVFPFRGRRTIQVDLRVRDRLSGDVRSEVAADWVTTIEDFGYIEQENVDEQAHAEALKLAMCMAACDGQVDDSEVACIKEWGSKSVKSLPEVRQARRRQTLNAALTLATTRLRTGDADRLLDDAVHGLLAVGEEPHLYEAYELCLRVAKADGVADPEELALANRIARRLDLDERKVKLLSDRHLSDLKIRSFGEPDSEDKILGIDPSMDREEIRRHLNKLYQQNQAKRRNPDPDVRKRAHDMVERITKARRRHLG